MNNKTTTVLAFVLCFSLFIGGCASNRSIVDISETQASTNATETTFEITQESIPEITPTDAPAITVNSFLEKVTGFWGCPISDGTWEILHFEDGIMDYFTYAGHMWISDGTLLSVECISEDTYKIRVSYEDFDYSNETPETQIRETECVFSTTDSFRRSLTLQLSDTNFNYTYLGNTKEDVDDYLGVYSIDIPQESWSPCPLDISQIKMGAYFSNSEITSCLLTLTINNTSPYDISAAKFMISFYTNSNEHIVQCFAIDSLMAGMHKEICISVGNYNFSEVEIYPMCAYYYNGSMWGNSEATLENLQESTPPFYFNSNDWTPIIEDSSGFYYDDGDGFIEITKEEYEDIRGGMLPDIESIFDFED